MPDSRSFLGGGLRFPMAIGPDGSVCVYTSVDAHLIVDVAGWFSGGSPASFTGNVPIGICAGVTYLIAVPLIWWCHRRSGLPLVGFPRGPGHAVPPPGPRGT